MSETGYYKVCIEHKLRLVDGRCPECRDKNGNTFILDMQSYFLIREGQAITETENLP
jgi:hypothetical protein